MRNEINPAELPRDLGENWGAALFTITFDTGETLDLSVSGRGCWALGGLIAAGSNGCTPLDTLGPRWSGYIHHLRMAGVPIETVTEPHGGPLAGTHARYILGASVTRAGECAA